MLKIFIMALGIIAGIWIGVIWGFVGGIVQVITSITPEIMPIGIAWGLAKAFVLAPVFGWGSVILCFGIADIIED